MEYTRTYLKQLAQDRASGKQAWGRNWNQDAFYIGLIGEAEFAKMFDCEIDTTINDGDNGIDFDMNNLTIDVKTYEKAYNLFRETDRPCHADILVLAQYYPSTETARLIGWEFSTDMLKCPKKQFHPKAPINHYKKADKLRPMAELNEIFSKMNR